MPKNLHEPLDNRAGEGVVDGDGDGVILAGGLSRVSAGAGEGCGTAMRISSDTVTNLKPFASSASKVDGMASIVPG